MPAIASVIPNWSPIGLSGLLPVDVWGSGFDGTTKVNYDGMDVSTTLISSTRLQFTLNPSGAPRPRFVRVKVTGDPTVRYFQWTPGLLGYGDAAWYAPNT